MAAGLTTLIGATSVLGLGLIPLLAIGLTVFRYNNADPESHPQNARQVLYSADLTWSGFHVDR